MDQVEHWLAQVAKAESVEVLDGALMAFRADLRDVFGDVPEVVRQAIALRKAEMGKRSFPRR